MGAAALSLIVLAVVLVYNVTSSNGPYRSERSLMLPGVEVWWRIQSGDEQETNKQQFSTVSEDVRSPLVRINPEEEDDDNDVPRYPQAFLDGVWEEVKFGQPGAGGWRNRTVGPRTKTRKPDRPHPTQQPEYEDSEDDEDEEGPTGEEDKETKGKNAKKTRPNIFFVLVDDLGFGNVDFTADLFPWKSADFYDKDWGYRIDMERRKKEITKSSSFLSSLAAEGRVLMRHYVHCTCSPTRSALQTGRLPVHVQISLANPCHVGSGAPKEMTCIAQRMREANYSTHFVGKWDAGMASYKQIPVGRGYESSLNFFSHGNWMWTEDVWIGSLINASRPPDCLLERGCARDLWDTNKPANKLNGTLYEEALFKNRLLEIIYRESANPQPLFLMYHPRVAHYPLQAPWAYQRKFDFITQPHRKVYTSMVAYMDDVIKVVVGALKDTNRWKNTLMVFTSDNGGVVKSPERCVEARRGLACFNGEAGANNFPLRGGKYTNWEGGVRVASFISGGFIPKHLRGTRVNGIMHIADWYSTFSALAGLDPNYVDRSAEKAGMPAIDSINMADMLLTRNTPSPRETILLSSHALIKGKLKILTGVQFGADWGGPLYPNLTTLKASVYSSMLVCQPACLYDVEDDPLETRDLAKVQPELVKEMLAELQKQSKTIWNRPRTNADPLCLQFAREKWGGFLGPFRDLPPNV